MCAERPSQAQHPRLKCILKGHTGPVETVTFSPDGRMVATSSKDGTIRVWETATGKVRMIFEDNNSSAVAFNPTKSILAVGRDNTVRLWGLLSGKLIATLKGHRQLVVRVAFSGDGKLLASGSNDATVMVWDVDKGQEKATLKGHFELVNDIAFSPNGKRIASVAGRTPGNCEIKLWSVATWEEETSWKAEDLGNRIAFDPDSTRIVATPKMHSDLLQVWDVNSGKKTTIPTTHDGIVRCVAFSPNGKVLATGGSDYSVKLLDSVTHKEKSTLRAHGGVVSCVGFSGDGKLLASASWDGTVCLWNMP
jgi:WD40 repeat protein